MRVGYNRFQVFLLFFFSLFLPLDVESFPRAFYLYNFVFPD